MPSGKAYSPLQVSPELYKYCLDCCLRENDFLKRLRDVTEEMPQALMLSDPAQVQFMVMLLQLMGASRGVEVGVFTGYTTLACAQVIPEDGKIIACDVSEEFTGIGKKFWEEAGVADKIDLRLAPATETLESLLPDQEGTFDWVYIDADKGNYPKYYQLAKRLVRKGGLIMIDNVLWSGEIINEEKKDDLTLAIREVNEATKNDQDIDVVMLTIADGMTVCRKK